LPHFNDKGRELLFSSREGGREIMATGLKLMCVLAHPDDESLGNGGTLAKYAAEGVETYLVTATRGERGWTGSERDDPGLEALGKIREVELFAAASVLGIRRVDFLDYIDGDLDKDLWDPQTYYRAFSLVNGGRGVETDVFEGLR
jgi:LmbE family N-acetylglucosaminyl deacetylase